MEHLDLVIFILGRSAIELREKKNQTIDEVNPMWDFAMFMIDVIIIFILFKY